MDRHRMSRIGLALVGVAAAATTAACVGWMATRLLVAFA